MGDHDGRRPLLRARPDLDDHVSEPSRDEAPVVDRAYLAALARDIGGEDVLAEICDLFLSDLDARMDALRRAAAAGDGATLRAGAHQLKGGAANIGAVAAAAAAGELEQLATAGRLDAVAPPLARLAEAVRLTQAALGTNHLQ